MFKEIGLRSMVKAVSWRLVASLTTFLIVFITTKQLVLSIGIGLLDTLIKLMLYFGHERIWNCIKWGRMELKK